MEDHPRWDIHQPVLKNYIGGGARGLECDKFSEDAVKLQFNKWFGEIYNQVGEDAHGTLTRMLCDSWGMRQSELDRQISRGI